jgi:hypothetical protein
MLSYFPVALRHVAGFEGNEFIGHYCPNYTQNWIIASFIRLWSDDTQRRITTRLVL